MAEAIVLALAQICAFEAGLSTDTRDCPAIAQVLRARRLDTPERMFRYSKVRGWPLGAHPGPGKAPGLAPAPDLGETRPKMGQPRPGG